jgi:diguanylate cyclase (GGDEF)-like protein
LSDFEKQSTGEPSTRILVVDDDKHIGRIVSMHLEQAGYQTTSVLTAEEAVELLDGNAFGLVITDLRLPGMNGLDLIRKVRKHSTDIDFVAVTGYADNDTSIQAITAGAADFITKPINFEELLLRIKRVLAARDIRLSRDELLHKFQQLAITDDLTGLHNSRHFHRQVQAETGRADRYNRHLSLLMMDVDHFKAYNDRHGHLAGDRALARIGAIIADCLRKSDTAYRYGGEEFTALLPETSAQEAAGVAERVRATVAGENFAETGTDKEGLTVSIGVTELARGEEPRSLVHRADEAMYTSKQQGRNRVSILLGRPADG